MTAVSYETTRHVQEWGRDWADPMQQQVEKVGLLKAKAAIASGKYEAANGYVEVSVPVKVTFRFEVKGDALVLAEDGVARCACVWHGYPEGGGACICTGPGADACDCSTIVVSA